MLLLRRSTRLTTAIRRLRIGGDESGLASEVQALSGVAFPYQSNVSSHQHHALTAQRPTPRFFSTTAPLSILTRNTIYNISQRSTQAFQSSPLAVVQQRSLVSATAPSMMAEPPSASLQLADILTRELDEELENNGSSDSSSAVASVPEDLAALRQTLETEGGWKIVLVHGSSLTRMLKTTTTDSGTSVKVQVAFHCQDTVEEIAEEEAHDGADEDQHDGDDAHDDNDMEAAAPVRFTVVATKAGKSSLVFHCYSEEATVRIQSLSVSTTSTPDELLTEGGVAKNDYQGPEFTELAEDLQDAFYEYLNETLGIGEDVAAFVAMQADFQEQCDYIKFLEDAKAIVE